MTTLTRTATDVAWALCSARRLRKAAGHAADWMQDDTRQHACMDCRQDAAALAQAGVVRVQETA